MFFKKTEKLKRYNLNKKKKKAMKKKPKNGLFERNFNIMLYVYDMLDDSTI